MQQTIEHPDLALIAEEFSGVRYFPPEPPLDASDTLHDGFDVQFEASLKRLKAKLIRDGINLSHVLRAEIHVTRDGPGTYGSLQDAFLQGFSSLPRPARCVSASPALGHGGIVEIGAFAADGKPDPAGAIIAPDGPAPCAPFPHARTHAGGLWATAQVGSDPATGSLAPVTGGSAAQLRYAASNLTAILRAGGGNPWNIVHGRLQHTIPAERAMLAKVLATCNLPVEAFQLVDVPFIPTAQTGVTVKLDAVACCGI